MKIDDVMDEIGDALDTIPGTLRVYRFPVDSIEPPAAIVQLPTIEYDRAFARGLDQVDGGIIVAVSRAWDRAARDAITKFIGGEDSPESIHAALHRRTTANEWTSCAYARVVRSYPLRGFTLAEAPFAAYQFDLDIAGNGS